MEQERLRIDGVITVLNTPFDERNVVDLTAVRRNARRAIDAGVSGFLVPAMAGEVGKLTVAERVALVEAVIEECAGAVPVIGGASAETLEERVTNVRRMRELGCDGVLIALPYEDEATYRAAVEALAREEPPFLMIQDWDFTGYGAPVALIAKLFEEIPQFRSLKVEVVPAGVKYSEVIEATGGRLHVAGGWAVGQMIEGLDRGVHAFMPTGMHEVYCEIYRRYADGDRQGAQELFRRLLPVLAFANQHLDISIHFFKRLLREEGFYPTAKVREPILPFDEVHERLAADLIELAIRLTEEVREEQHG
jgi:4-hydroxy-tetrahydrodipicolinate synthase